MSPRRHRSALPACAGALLAFALAPGMASAAVAPECGALPPPGAARCLALRVISSSSPGAGAQRRSLTAARTAPPNGSLGPGGLHVAYGLPTATAAANGQTVAIVDAYDNPHAEADLAAYDSQFGLPACTTANGCFTKVNQLGQASPLPSTDWAWAGEIALDVETVHAICQNCKILLVEANTSDFADLDTAENLAAAHGGVGEISNSYSGDEAGGDDPAFNHPGIAITAATGDNGYLDWSSANVSPQYPATSPNVIAVGGTRLSTGPGGSWSSETAWTGGGSGCSQLYTAKSWQQSAAGYAATGCGTDRSTADVAADADPNSGVAVYGPNASGVDGWDQVGGTSLSAPIVAATYGLAGGAQGASYPAATLYAQETNAPTGLHDVTVGANGCTGAVCPAGSNCGAATSCQAGPGYDGPTGVGTPAGLTAFIPAAGTASGGSGGGAGGPPGAPGGSATPVPQPAAGASPATSPPPPAAGLATSAPGSTVSGLSLPGGRLARAHRRGPSLGGGLAVLVGLSAPGVVRFTVFRQVTRRGHRDWVRVSGAFSIRGRRGLNRLRFTGRLSGLPLPRGRYLLVAVGPSGPGQAAVFRIS